MRRLLGLLAWMLPMAALADPGDGPAAPASAPAPKPPGRHALLVGCTRYDSLPATSQLRGPANDVVLMRELLTRRFHFPAERIATLAEAGPAANRPTRDHIEREFRRLAREAGPGDQVVILLSGHGSQQPDEPPNPADPEPDGLDEIFLPADIGRWDLRAGNVKNAIVDDEIGAWLAAIRARGASLWVVIDACHSGTMFRGDGREQLRRVAPEDLVPAEALAQARERARGTPTVDPGGEAPFGAAARDGLAVISASRSDEPAVEKPLPDDDPKAESKPYGLLTFALARVLDKPTSPLTYRDLLARIHQQYAAWDRNFPTPTLEGDADRYVLGDDARVGPAAFLLSRGADGAWRIDGGRLHGLTAGAVLAVAPPAGLGDDVVGHVRIADAPGPGILESVVEPCGPEGRPAPGKPEPGQRCRPVRLDYGDLRLKVAVDPVTEAGEPIPEADVRRSEAIVRALAGEANALVVAHPAVPGADWLIRRASPKDGASYLVPGSGFALVDAGLTADPAPGAVPPAFGPIPPGDKAQPWLKDALRRIARSRNLVKIAADPEQARRWDPKELGLAVELRLYHDGRDAVGAPATTVGGGPVLQAGQRVGFAVKNTGRSRLDVTVLAIDSGYGITLLYPRNGTDNRLRRDEELPVVKAIVDARTFGLERLVVIGAVPGENAGPKDFGFLEQPTIDRARGVAEKGGGEADALDSPLGQLLQNAMFGEGATRSLALPEAEKLVTVVLPYRTVPAPGPLAGGPPAPGGGTLVFSAAAKVAADAGQVERALTPPAADRPGPLRASRDRLRGPAADIYPKAAPAVVFLTTANAQNLGDGGVHSNGTGILVDPEGWVLTNAHVVEDARPDQATGAMGMTAFLGTYQDGAMQIAEPGLHATVYKLSKDKDLALLKLAAPPAGVTRLPALAMAARVPPIGGDCVVLGHPARGMLWTIRTGQINQVGDWPGDMIDTVSERLVLPADDQKTFRKILADAPRRRIVISSCRINHGDSGGPLLNAEGELIGVTYAKPAGSSDSTDNYDAFAYHVHLDEVKAFLAGRPAKPLLSIPDVLPPAIFVKVADLDDDGTPEAIAYFGATKRLSGLLVNLEGTGLPDPRKGDAGGRISFALHLAPRARAFYDRDGDGRLDLILDGGPPGQAASTALARDAGGDWAIHKAPTDSLLDGALFEKPATRKQFDRLRQTFRDLVESSATPPKRGK